MYNKYNNVFLFLHQNLAAVWEPSASSEMVLGAEDLQMLPLLRSLHQVCRPGLLPGRGDQVSLFYYGWLTFSFMHHWAARTHLLITAVPEGWLVPSLQETWVRVSLKYIIYNYCFSLFALNLKVAETELSLPRGRQWLSPSASTKHFGPPSSPFNYF